MSSSAPFAQVQRARTLLRSRPAEGGLFHWDRLVGRVVEVSEAGLWGALSAVTGLMLEGQRRHEVVAWISTGSSVFFPPDLAFRGLDVQALPVVLAPNPSAGLQSLDGLLRSGAFGLLVVDWVGGAVEEGALGRLARVAEDRKSTVVFLTRKAASEPSVATQISLRGAVTREASGETSWVVLKDKHSGPPRPQRTVFGGPLGLY